MHDNTGGRTDEQQEARRRLDEEARQPLLHGPAVATEIQGAANDPDEPKHRSGKVAQVDRTKPQRYQESRHPFERVRVRAKDTLEVGIAGRCRELYVELAVRRCDTRREEEI